MALQKAQQSCSALGSASATPQEHAPPCRRPRATDGQGALPAARAAGGPHRAGLYPVQRPLHGQRHRRRSHPRQHAGDGHGGRQPRPDAAGRTPWPTSRRASARTSRPAGSTGCRWPWPPRRQRRPPPWAYSPPAPTSRPPPGSGPLMEQSQTPARPDGKLPTSVTEGVSWSGCRSRPLPAKSFPGRPDHPARQFRFLSHTRAIRVQTATLPG